MEENTGAAALLGLASLVPYTGLVLVLTYSTSIMNSLGLCGLLIIFPAMVVFFFGGLGFNFLTWGLIFMALGDSPVGGCCACPCFFVCAFVLYLASGTGSPVLRSWQIDSLKPLEHVGICTEEWRDFQGSIYFEDGSLAEDHHMPRAIPINITHCYAERQKGRVTEWRDCHFMVRPVFQCDVSPFYAVSDACTEPRACAWAITGSIWEVPAPPEKPECRPGRGLCGFMMTPEMFAPMITDESKDTFHKELQAAGKEFPGNLTGTSPLLSLVNPKQEAASLRWWRPVYYLLIFLYVPFGALVALLVAACEFRGGRTIQCSLWNRSEGDSSPEEWYSNAAAN
ncbi:unnamed protein product [Symbiodinium sp. CCMP2592]|nr:unnamed protein product [Symbiodinium sp. CCMP2592]